MLILKYIVATCLLLVTTVRTQQDQDADISYHVIALLNQTVFKSMAVLVDSTVYPLKPNSTFPILYSGKAPRSKSGYQYMKIYTSTNLTLSEPFKRQPVIQDTPHEFFNRTWNTHENVQLPTIYQPLSVIHRIESKLHRDNEIPTIHISGNQREIDQMHHNVTSDMTVKAKMSYISLYDALSFQNIEISLVGHSTRRVSKLSYGLKINERTLYGYRSLKLRALITDPSYVREQIVYNMVKSVGIVSSEFSYVRVMMNEQELGLFGIVEAFKSNWLSNVFANGDRSYQKGYLYQGLCRGKNDTISDLSYSSDITAYAHGQYKAKNIPKGKKKVWEPLQAFTEFITHAPTNTSDAFKVWKKQLDTDSFLRSMALEVLLGFTDGYLAKVNNFYLYQMPELKKNIYIPFDMDLTFGSGVLIKSPDWRGNYTAFPNINTRPLFNQMMLVPEFKEEFRRLIQDINIKLLNPQIINPRIKDIASMIQQDIAWDKSLSRVNDDTLEHTITNSIKKSSKNNILEAKKKQQRFEKTLEFFKAIDSIASYEVALNGPTGYECLPGIMEWISDVHKNTIKFFSRQ